MAKVLLASTCALFLAVGLPRPPCARAESPKALDKAAKKACLSGDPRKGAEILTQLFVDTEDATYLFNLGRCYEQNHRWQEALDAFREYKRKAPKVSRVVAADTDKHIADCEIFLAKEEAKTMPQPTPAPVGQGATAAPVPMNALPSQAMAPLPPTDVATASVPVATPAASGAGLRIAGIVVGGVGVATAVAGLLFNLQANSLADEVNQHYSRSKDSTRSSYETLSWVGYGVGAAAIVAGGICYVLGVRQRSASAAGAVGVVPAIGREQAGLVLQGAF